MRINLRRARSRLTIVAVVFALVLTAAASSLVMGGRSLPQAHPGRANAAITPLSGAGSVPAGAIVRVDVSGTGDNGPATASAYGIVVDSSGLVLAPANVVDPLAPGVAVGWHWPFIGFNVTQIVVSTSAGSGQPFTPTYVASVAATDGVLDSTVLKLDSTISATGTTAPVAAGSLNLPAVPIAAADPAVGAPVSLATYTEAGATPTGVGTFTVTPGTVTAFEMDDHLPGKNWWVDTDIAQPVAFPGGAIVDATGALVAMASWLPDSPPQQVYGPDAPLIAAVVAAAKAGTPYVSPYVIPGTGAEAATLTGFGTGASPCDTTAPVTSYPTGAAMIAALFSFTGFTPNEDSFSLWFDPDSQQVLTYSLDPWTFGATGTCLSEELTSSSGPLPDGSYAYNLFAGGDLHFLQGATTTIGQPGVGAVQVTGRVVDADTGKPIAAVSVFILKQGVDPQTWFQTGAQTDVASAGITDADGVYTTQPAIVPGDYPFVVVPNDNHQVVGGTVTIPADGKMPDITLTTTN